MLLKSTSADVFFSKHAQKRSSDEEFYARQI